ncbi:alpha/beta hydrolase [Corynebacterium callunae]|uniref:alpha/beta fold hydrolase n=1 Tax=Corynebacterium callunae TaxID=1721 RepID=UPI0039819D41
MATSKKGLSTNPSSFRTWWKNLRAQRRMATTVASIERSPNIVALEGPFNHEHVFVRGVRLHLATAGSPTNPLVLLIHGAFGGWFDYREVISPLADAGFHVAAIDLRGYGMSDKPPAGYDLRHAAGDISSVIAALGHDDAILVGSDTGASIAWVSATMYPERVRGLVSLGAIHPSDMNRAMLLKPYLFLPDLGRRLVFGVPTPAYRLLSVAIARSSQREITSNTSVSFQRSNAFREITKLRKKALGIDHTLGAIVRTNRFLAGQGPAKHAKSLVSAPVLILKQNTQRWEYLAHLAKTRSCGKLHILSIPGGFELPYWENPAEFARGVEEFARGL